MVTPRPHSDRPTPCPRFDTLHQSLRGTTTADFATVPAPTGDKQGAFAGELEDKAAWAGIDDPLRVATNAIRVSDNLPPLAAEPALSKAALELAKDLVRAWWIDCQEWA